MHRDVLAQAIRAGAASRDFFGTAYGQHDGKTLGGEFDGTGAIPSQCRCRFHTGSPSSSASEDAPRGMESIKIPRVIKGGIRRNYSFHSVPKARPFPLQPAQVTNFAVSLAGPSLNDSSAFLACAIEF
jgi:hypothetical protein